MKMRLIGVLLGVCGCASGGLKPVPEKATPAERLEAAEAAATSLHGARLAFVTEAKGMLGAQLTGTIDFFSKNVIAYAAEGQFGSDQVRVELDTREGRQSRSLSKGASVSNHQEPVPELLSESVGVMLVRMGLMHTVANLIADTAIERSSGGIRDWVKTTGLRDLGPQTEGEVPCHRVEFGMLIEGKELGKSSVCIADASGLPVDHTTLVKNESGEMTVSERYTWSFNANEH